MEGEYDQNQTILPCSTACNVTFSPEYNNYASYVIQRQISFYQVTYIIITNSYYTDSSR